MSYQLLQSLRPFSSLRRVRPKWRAFQRANVCFPWIGTL